MQFSFPFSSSILVNSFLSQPMNSILFPILSLVPLGGKRANSCVELCCCQVKPQHLKIQNLSTYFTVDRRVHTTTKQYTIGKYFADDAQFKLMMTRDILEYIQGVTKTTFNTTEYLNYLSQTSKAQHIVLNTFMRTLLSLIKLSACHRQVTPPARASSTLIVIPTSGSFTRKL